MSYLSSEGGGGGAGNPSLPFNSIQYNNNGNFFGDSNATRDPLTQQTRISRMFSGGQTGSLLLRENTIFGVLPFAGIFWDNGAQGINNFNGISDLSPLGGTENAIVQGLVNTLTNDLGVAILDGDQTTGISYLANIRNTTFSGTRADFNLNPAHIHFVFDDYGQGTNSNFYMTPIEVTADFNDGTNSSSISMSGLENELLFLNGLTGSTSKVQLQPDYAFFGFQNNSLNESSYFLAGHFKTSVTFQTSALGPTVLTELNAGTNGAMYLWDVYKHFEINVPLRTHRLGDLDGQFNNSYIIVDDNSKAFRFMVGSNSHLDLNAFSGIYEFGDVDGVANKTRITIRDSSKNIDNITDGYWRVESSTGQTQILADIFNKTLSNYVDYFNITQLGGSNTTFIANTTDRRVLMGDILGLTNQTTLYVQDNLRTITGTVKDGSGGVFTLDMQGSGQYAGFSANDGGNRTNFIRASAISSFMTSQEFTEQSTLQVVPGSVIGSSTDGGNTFSLQLAPTFAFIQNQNGEGISIDTTTKSISFTGSEYWKSTVIIDSNVTTTYNVPDNIRVIYVDSTTASVTINLPGTAGADKRLITIKDIGDAMSNPITVSAIVGTVEVPLINVTGMAVTYQGIDQTGVWYAINKY